jgi:hypothetical protein
MAVGADEIDVGFPGIILYLEGDMESVVITAAWAGINLALRFDLPCFDPGSHFH